MLPFDGLWHHAAHRKYKEVILFVHHFRGDRSQLKRHIDFVNELGFDAISFNLSFNKKTIPSRIPWDSEQNFGYLNVWKEEISHIMNSISDPIIVYSFSSISSAALMAIGDRSANYVSAFICDSGPFIDSIRCFWNLYTHGYKTESLIKRSALTLSTIALYGLKKKDLIDSAMHKVPARLPILSIRGWKDPLVPYDAIDGFFKPYEHLNLEVLALPEAKHIDGLKNFPEDYKPRVQGFLEGNSQNY